MMLGDWTGIPRKHIHSTLLDCLHCTIGYAGRAIPVSHEGVMMWAAMWDRASKQKNRPLALLQCASTGSFAAGGGPRGIPNRHHNHRHRLQGCRLCRTNTVGYDSSYAITYLVCRASQLPR